MASAARKRLATTFMAPRSGRSERNQLLASGGCGDMVNMRNVRRRASARRKRYQTPSMDGARATRRLV